MKCIKTDREVRAYAKEQGLNEKEVLTWYQRVRLALSSKNKEKNINFETKPLDNIQNEDEVIVENTITKNNQTVKTPVENQKEDIIPNKEIQNTVNEIKKLLECKE